MTFFLNLHTLSKSRRPLVWLAGCLFLLVALPALGQSATEDSPNAADPAALARRLMGVDVQQFIPPPTPQYAPGDKLEFTVGKTTAPEPTRIQATLAAASPNIYLWAEEGLPFSPDAMANIAGQLDRIANLLRWRSTYSDVRNLPGSQGQILDVTNLFPLPDIDNDPHLFFLYTTNLADDRSAVYNPNDSLPADMVPGGYSNQHEVIAINTTPFAGERLENDLLTGIAVRALFDLITLTNNPGQAPWLTEALGSYVLLQIQQTPLTAGDVAIFLSAPNTPLTQRATLTTSAQTRAAQELFLNYFEQRYGTGPLLSIFTSAGEGIEPFTAVLQARGVTDPVTGAFVTGDDAFADFALTNGINTLFGDNRYFHLQPRLNRGELAAATDISPLTGFDAVAQTVNQYGSLYYRGGANNPTIVTVTFDGQPTTPRLPMPALDDATNHFYWSGHGRDRDVTLTRSFDLTGVEQATLHFDAWYNLADSWNYGYVEVSENGGRSWDIVRASGTPAANRNGVAYGPGFTGISNPEGPKPFPIMGVLIAGDGETLTQILSDGPAAKSDLRENDRIIGYDGKPWSGAPNVLGLLADYNPGDTVNLLVARGDQQLNVPLVLGAHPTRVKEPRPLWQPQTVDLTPYAGSAVLVRFEAISMTNRDDEGIALDNLAVPEIDYRDDAEADSDWEADGWQRIDNHVPQRFLVQAATSGTQNRPPTAQQLIGPGDNSTSGEWKIAVDAGQAMVISVSGVTGETTQPARFELHLAG